MKINERGITLIALVITIIILLILAGVALSLVVGDNGVLNKSMNAVDETNRAATQEQLELAISSVITDWFTDRAVDGSTPKLADYMTGEKVKAVMNNKYQLNEFILNTEKGVKVAYAGASYDFTVQITESGNGAKVFYAGSNGGNPGTGSGGTIGSNPIVPSKLFEIGEAINVENYGKEVIGYKAKSNSGYSGNWRLFYQDTLYAYIIVDDVIESYNPSEYYSEYASGKEVGIIGRSLNSKLMDAGNFFSSSNTTNCIKALAWMTDPEKWKDYKDDEGMSAFAIGGPSLELFEASYNATAKLAGREVVESDATHISEKYIIDWRYNNGIYNYDNITHWWLATTGFNYKRNVFLLNDTYLSEASRAVRPIVAIPSSTFSRYTLSD